MSQTTSTATTNITMTRTNLETASGRLFKGKDIRSWQQLPPEIIRLIATHYLLAVSKTLYTPTMWEMRELWPSRLVYTVLRDALELEKLQYICPPWHAALESHLFWQHACAVIDPDSVFAKHAIIRPPTTTGSANAPAFTLSPYRHFRNITNCSCFVCRINFPFTSVGLASAKRTVYSEYFNVITTCRDHRKGTYCSLCFRVAPLDDSQYSSCIADNEDDETWPRVETTCQQCRTEFLWRRIGSSSVNREAFGGSPVRWNKISDWEVRQAVDNFIDMGEGTISDIICLAQEKHWLHGHTKLRELLQQAMAASRFTADGELVNEEDFSAEEEDVELLSMTEDAGGIRELAITDWARNRILDGHWLSPEDQWRGNIVPEQPVIEAMHPCPWVAYSGALLDGEEDNSLLEHPRPSTYQATCPPSYALSKTIWEVYRRVMREILSPAMANIVRKVTMECERDHTDASIKVARMSIDDVVAELKNGVTWLRRMDRAELIVKETVTGTRQTSEDDDTSSSHSGESHTTSPVLSTTTLQTTPSPPPSGKDEEEEGSPLIGAPPISPDPASPLLQRADLIHPIPYIPSSISDMPECSLGVLKAIWREACTPLYNCQCSVCKRAILAAHLAAETTEAQQLATLTVQQPPVHIQLRLPAHVRQEEEEEDDLDDVDDVDDDLEDDESDSEETKAVWLASHTRDSTPSVLTPQDTEVQTRTRNSFSPSLGKRSQDIRDVDEPASIQLDSHVALSSPKRPRLNGSFSSQDSNVSDMTSTRRKRSSEELEEAGESLPNGKRVKGGIAMSGPVSP